MFGWVRSLVGCKCAEKDVTITQLQGGMETWMDKCREADTRIRELEQDVATERDIRQSLEKSLNEKDVELRRSSDLVESLRKQVNDLTADNGQWSCKFDYLHTEKVKCCDRVKELEAEVESLKQTIANMNEERTMLCNQVQKLMDDKRMLQEQNAELYHKVEDLEKGKEELRSTLEKKVEEMDVMEDRASDARVASGKVDIADIEADVKKRRKSVKAEAQKRNKAK